VEMWRGFDPRHISLFDLKALRKQWFRGAFAEMFAFSVETCENSGVDVENEGSSFKDNV